jgi:hypothetical protein
MIYAERPAIAPRKRRTTITAATINPVPIGLDADGVDDAAEDAAEPELVAFEPRDDEDAAAAPEKCEMSINMPFSMNHSYLL